MIHEEICTYDVCKLAKEKGFDWDCPMFYNPEGELEYGWAYDPMNSGLDMRDMLCHNSKLPLGFGAECSAPTQSLLQRWLREEKKIHINICAANSWNIERTDGNILLSHNNHDYISTHISSLDVMWDDNKGCFDTYELALEDALAYSLKNLV